MRRITLIGLLTATTLSACATSQPEAPNVIIDTAPIQTCAPVATLQKVTIPAETKKQTAITMIDNPPYEPIETRVERQIVITPAQVLFVDGSGREVIDICETNIARGYVGPGPGAIIGPDGNVTYDE